jgi:hypothetical protein
MIAPLPLRFESWQRWTDRAGRPSCAFPGVYAISISEKNLADTEFSVLESIIYFGMTNVELRWRLENFHKTATLTRCEHGGAERFVYKHQDFNKVSNQLFVAQWPFEAPPKPSRAETLRLKGRVLQAEYECFAAYVEAFGDRLPEFNRPDSPKYAGKYTKKIKFP